MIFLLAHVLKARLTPRILFIIVWCYTFILVDGIQSEHYLRSDRSLLLRKADIQKILPSTSEIIFSKNIWVFFVDLKSAERNLIFLWNITN